MTALDLFTYRDQQVRTVVIDGEPWFVAADVCAVLGIANSRDALGRLDDDEKGVATADTLGGPQQVAVVNEPGVYGLTWTSRKPEAAAFRRWIKHEVLPQIARTGEFRQTEPEHALPQSYADALRELATSVERREALEAKVAEDAPKVEAYDALMDSDGYYSMEAAAKVLGIGRTTFYRRLREAGIVQTGSRLPYQRYMHHFHVTAATYTTPDWVEHTSYTPRVLPSGLDYLRKRLGLAPTAS